MPFDTDPAMAEALRQTRAGNLAGATRTIQAMLAGRAPAASAAPSPARPATGVIDLTAGHVTVAPRAPAAGASRFEERTYAGPHGTLDYRLYIPAHAAAGLPLVVMLHGCTQSPDDFARGTGMNALADELGFLVAYPRQPASANPQKCWNWFRPGDQRRDAGEPALIAGATRRIIVDEGADPARIYVAGLSAGGAAAAIMAAAYPDLYAAVGIHSGLACGAARDLPGAMMAMRQGGRAVHGTDQAFVPTITFHGDRDTTVAEANAREIVAAATRASGRSLHTESTAGTSRSGRRYTRVVSRDAGGRALIEQWTVHAAGHAWSGGDKSGSFTDPAGPEASREMMRFFLDHRLEA